jgi:hypothetical protein
VKKSFSRPNFAKAKFIDYYLCRRARRNGGKRESYSSLTVKNLFHARILLKQNSLITFYAAQGG